MLPWRASRPAPVAGMRAVRHVQRQSHFHSANAHTHTRTRVGARTETRVRARTPARGTHACILSVLASLSPRWLCFARHGEYTCACLAPAERRHRAAGGIFDVASVLRTFAQGVAPSAIWPAPTSGVCGGGRVLRCWTRSGSEARKYERFGSRKAKVGMTCSCTLRHARACRESCLRCS